MDQAVTQLLTMGTLYIAAAVVIVTFFIRRIVETAVPSLKKGADENAPGPTYLTALSRWWNGVILYLLPVASGSLMTMTSWAAEWGLAPKTTGSAVVYGGIVGWFSSFLYKVLTKALKDKTGIDPTPGPASIVSSRPPAAEYELKSDENSK